MIHYDLRCAGGHEFDGWFRSSAAFDYQAEQGLVECPACGGNQVSRALMAPRLNRGAAEPATPPEPKPASGPPAMAVGGMPAVPDQVRAVLQRIRAEVEQKCDYVGPRFAEEARAIHEGAVPVRPIYGEATEEQAEIPRRGRHQRRPHPLGARADG